MAQGKIRKGIAGFYYVDAAGSGVYECKAKGIFRKEDQKPLVGDEVEFQVISEEEKTGNITEILPRKNELIRPAVANVDQVLVVFAVTKPEPHLNLLDRFLVNMERYHVPCRICFNKVDLAREGQVERLEDIYKKTGYPYTFISVKTGENLASLSEAFRGKTTVLAGPSGAGKSSILNYFCPDAGMETGEISRKISRGKNTTRHSELFSAGENTYLCDTPGFSSLLIDDFDKEELKQYFPEFAPYEGQCRFLDCEHLNEPDCAVKKAVEDGEIAQERYCDYVALYEELKEKRRY